LEDKSGWVTLNRFEDLALKKSCATLTGVFEAQKSNLPLQKLSPGVDVMMKIFRFFANFRRNKVDVFLKNQCDDQIRAKTSLSLRKIFGDNILKTIASVPGIRR
jgi:ribosome maturation factor RimP